MTKIERITKGYWQRQGVKFKLIKGAPHWIKTLRSVECAICHKKKVEKEFDEGFDNWHIFGEIIGTDGMAPELCPECAAKLNLRFSPCRRMQCKKCGTIQKEKIYGIGFPGWLSSPTSPNKALIDGFCPNCHANFILPSMPQFAHETWTSLTYASNSLLTSTKMTQNQANFTAIAYHHQSAPNDNSIVVNAYYDGSDSKSIAAGHCARVLIHTNGEFRIQYYSASGANETITWSSIVGFTTAGLLSIGNVADAKITQAKLSTTTAVQQFEITGDTTENNEYTPTGAIWTLGWQSAWGEDPGGSSYIVIDQIGKINTGIEYTGIVQQTAFNDYPIARNANTRNNYIQASPPYEIEHFIFMLVDSNGGIKGISEAPDPVWTGQRMPWEKQLEPEDLPHPYVDMKPGQKVVLINPSKVFMDELVKKRKQQKREYVDIIRDEYAMDKLEKPRGELTERVIAQGVEFRKLRKVN